MAAAKFKHIHGVLMTAHITSGVFQVNSHTDYDSISNY